jgi:isoleucyl-tRNA synthetase
MNQELSAFYFDVRKDVLYCDPASSTRKQASLQVLETLFRNVTAWLAPVLPFTTEEAYLAVYPDAVSVHLEQFPELPVEWRDDALAEKWATVKRVRSVVTACLEAERQVKRIGSALEAAPSVFVAGALASVLHDVPMAEVCITSGLYLQEGSAPDGAFTLDGVDGVSVVFDLAAGVRCARSWVVSKDVGSDPEYPDVSMRDAAALRELSLAA